VSSFGRPDAVHRTLSEFASTMVYIPKAKTTAIKRLPVDIMALMSGSRSTKLSTTTRASKQSASLCSVVSSARKKTVCAVAAGTHVPER
jgi:hypothetical protein